MRSLLSVSLAITALLASSCGGTENRDTSAAVAMAIGPEGGTIEVGGAVVTFPKGAVAASTNVTITAMDTGVPEGFIALSRVFRCEPSGTDFAQPVEMRMPFTDDGKGGSLFWSTGSDPTFKDLGGRVEGKIMVATVRHFSAGFVGRKK